LSSSSTVEREKEIKREREKEREREREKQGKRIRKRMREGTLASAHSMASGPPGPLQVGTLTTAVHTSKPVYINHRTCGKCFARIHQDHSEVSYNLRDQDQGTDAWHTQATNGHTITDSRAHYKAI
jgi:hypothetical protein